MEKKFNTKEVVIVAMVAAVIGVIYTLLDYAYMPYFSFKKGTREKLPNWKLLSFIRVSHIL